MKTKNLLFTFFSTVGITLSAQYTTGTVNLPTAGMTVKVDTNATQVTLTLTGDSNSMLAIGFSNNGMNSGDDGFIYNSTSNRDYTFGGVGVTPTADSSQDWTQTSNTVSGSTRTIVATRSLTGGSSDYAFSNTPGTIDIYYARRSGTQAIGNHGSLRDYTTLNKVLGVEDVDAVKSFGIPSLVDSELPILQFEKLKKIDIYDQNGRLIKNDIKPSEKVDVSSLQTGIYFLEIQDKSGNFLYHKIMKK